MSVDSEAFEVAHTHALTGKAQALVLCEHASNHFPSQYGTLGLDAEARASHIAWDPGALALSHALSQALNAPLVAGGVSRLLYDCNRPPAAPDAIPLRSEIYDIPGNQALTLLSHTDRVDRIYRPFCAAVDAAIATANPAALITMHTFTPVYNGQNRTVEIGVLHDADSRLADAMLTASTDAPFVVRRNQPYGPQDGVTHSLNLHAASRGLLNVMIEVRNDLVATTAGQQAVSAYLNPLIQGALDRAKAP